LTQAEAVRDLVNADTAFQARVAREQLTGRLSACLAPLQDRIVEVMAHLEAGLEFCEEDLLTAGREEAASSLRSVEREVATLLANFRVGRLVREGAWIGIVGKPNVGKSSLFNALLAEERAIVAELPGTTRDALREVIDLDGVPVHLVDTAGVRDTSDPVERLGVGKTKEVLGRSDLACLVVDGSSPFDAADWSAWRALGEVPCVLVRNKMDLAGRAPTPPEVEQRCLRSVEVSALTGWNLEGLRTALAQALGAGEGRSREGVLITDLRHRLCLEQASASLNAAIEGLEGGSSEEFPLEDLRGALTALAEITGVVTVEDLLDRVFSTFCIGK
jgi:tRNA modification GTPase